MPARAYVFDAYGTLLDVHAAIGKHRDKVGADAAAFSELWRTKQIEYSWTHSLLGHYVPFWTLTERALDFCLAKFPGVDRALKPVLLAAYKELGAYADARPCLEALRKRGIKTAILSNGSTEMLQSAVEAAKFTDVLDFVLSVDEIKSFKPGRAVYQIAVDRLGVAAADIAFVSSNRWDVAGSANFGFKPIWVNRAGNPDEYPDFQPVKVVKSLSEVEGAGI
ncbi:MAG TPA: haloacid dehalogenase type II [Xanthobacteraceae bacterium]|jgi:2-haloacid dehalogenase|nr:haloacid dehalogenase type II [Xanthobacteraceae bacterium]